MACSITQADLGPLFASLDADLVAWFIEQATGVVLGPSESHVAMKSVYKACGVDPCLMIKLLAQHMISVTPGSGGSGGTVQSERVADVSVSYATGNSSSSIYGGSPFGLAYAQQLAKFEKCRAGRNTIPRAVGPTRAG